ncbi:glycosyltransferase family 9 protein [Enterobacteriaceae bacterium BIT-l23]|uniref:glycosyltransferase family 9 protein n=1 Tax=Jejubacter sp. L23 TaxID=3092086 RepID=UPI001585283E|nr:glycosyltransferase family 9 protein [Enterobacteriaceae bacterium BIT-l23]
MRLGHFHKKKRAFLNRLKINAVSFFFSHKEKEVWKPGDSIKSCIIVHNNKKLGDLIVLSSLYRELHKLGIKLYILTDPAGYAFLQGNNKISGIFVKKSDSLRDITSVLKQVGELSYDLLIDPFETLPNYRHAIVLAGIKARHTLGFDRWYRRYYCTYNPHDENLSEHMASRAREIMAFLTGHALTNYNTCYDIPLPEHVEETAKAFVGVKPVVLINPFGAKKICRLSPQQISEIYHCVTERLPDFRVIFTGHPADLPLIKIEGAELCPFKDFIHTVALTKYADYLISVDTALVHIASAFNVPTLAFYPKARTDKYPSPLVWAPNNELAVQVIAPDCRVSDISLEEINQTTAHFLSDKSKKAVG